MPDDEQVEKIRQAIMRYRELLDVLKARTEHAERRYSALFAQLSAEQMNLPEKARQGAAALIALEDLDPLRRALLGAQFDLRDLERAFEETYHHIAPEE